MVNTINKLKTMAIFFLPFNFKPIPSLNYLPTRKKSLLKKKYFLGCIHPEYLKSCMKIKNCPGKEQQDVWIRGTVLLIMVVY